MITPKQVTITNVTTDQIARCYKVLSADGNYYMVESESDSQVEYTVKYIPNKGFTCTCEAGQYGFARCQHGYCKHVAWSMAAANEERLYMAALADQQAKELEEMERKAKELEESNRKAQAKLDREAARDANRLYASREKGRLAILEAVAMCNATITH